MVIFKFLILPITFVNVNEIFHIFMGSYFQMAQLNCTVKATKFRLKKVGGY